MNSPQIEHVRMGFTNGRIFRRLSVSRCTAIAQSSSPLNQEEDVADETGLTLGAQRAASGRTSHVILAVCKLGSLKYSGCLQTEEFSNTWTFALSTSVIISLIFK